MKTFEKWLIESELDEGFFDGIKQGFQQGYQQGRQPAAPVPGSRSNFDKFSNVALPAIKKAHAFAQSLSQKTGVPLPLATALIASGLTGGPAAVPFAALLYFVKTPLIQGASKAFDAGAAAIQNPKSLKQGFSNWGQKFASGLSHIGQEFKKGYQQGQQGYQQEHLTFKDYCDYRDYQEGFGDWAGQKIGSLAGRVSGNIVSAGQQAGNLIKQNFQQLKTFALENKLAIAKAAFLMGVGALVGAGVGKLTNAAMDAIVQNMHHAGIPTTGLKQELGLTADELANQPHPKAKDMFGRPKAWEPATAQDRPTGTYYGTDSGTVNQAGQAFDKYGNPAGGTYYKGGNQWTAKDASSFVK